MKTIVSNVGIEVLYPCTVHLLRNGEILECEYKSDHTGRELLDYICEYQSLSEKEYWGLKYVDTFEQRHWLELDKLIRSQVKNVCPIHFHFRVKVYPPEPYKITDRETRHQIFLQLRYDLISGRLCCGPNDSALLLALILQYIHGNFNPDIHIGNYIKDKIILNQNFMVETKAIEIHRNHLSGLNKNHIEDLFLRMSCQLEAYGIDPYLVEVHNQSNLNLWVNHNGMVTYVDNRKVHHLKWMDISKVELDDCKLIVRMANDEAVEFVCLTRAECNYIYRNVVDHFIHFTTTDKRSTASVVGSILAGVFEEVEEEIIVKVAENITKKTESFAEETTSQTLGGVTGISVPKSSLGKKIFTHSQIYAICILFLLVVFGIISNWDLMLERNYFGLQILNRGLDFFIKYILSMKR